MFLLLCSCEGVLGFLQHLCGWKVCGLQRLFGPPQAERDCMYGNNACVRVCVYSYVGIYVCMYAYMYVYTHAHTEAHIHTCIDHKTDVFSPGSDFGCLSSSR